jgi:hypothetical protein
MVGPRLRAAFVSAAVSAGVCVATVLLLHAPLGRSLLRHAGGAVCPAAGVSPAAVEDAQSAAFRAALGHAPAPSRMALGFELGRTPLGVVRSWARDGRLDCTAWRQDQLYTCRDVPGALLGQPGRLVEVAFEFTLKGQLLMNLTTLRTGLSASEAARAVADRAQALGSVLGEATVRLGPCTARYLWRAPVTDVPGAVPLQ